MSYSRWGSTGSGHWYTFWSAQYDQEIENYDNAVFEICMVRNFTAKELRTDTDKCLSIIEEIDPEVGTDKLEELRTYMNSFLEDIEQEYRGEQKCFT